MSFKVESTSTPAPSLGTNSPNQQSARDRAIAKLMTPPATQHPVSNPTQISPEELGALPQKGIGEEAPQATEDASQKADTPAKSEEQAPLSSQYAQLARKEKAIRAKAQEIRAKEDAIRAREEALKAKESTPATPQTPSPSQRDRWASGDVRERLAVLNEIGASYDDVTQVMLNQPSQETSQLLSIVDELKSEIKALRGEQENSKKSYAEQQQRQYQQAVNQIRNEVKATVSTTEDFETIRATSSYDDVVELIERTFKDDGVLLTADEACRQVEEYLVEEATKIAKLKKIQSRLAPQQAASKQTAESQTQGKTQSQPKTLTNSMTSAKPLSAKERAILAFQGKLQR